MTRSLAATSVPSASAYVSSPLASTVFDGRAWLTTLLVVAAMFAGGMNRASADLEVAQHEHIIADAPVNTGIHAARAGRLRDAITILSPHAERGNAMANYVLGLIYLRDRGMMKANPTRSHRHFVRAAATGHVASIFEAAFQFERGIGTARDMDRAIHLYQIAARANHLNAQFNLAVLLSQHEAERQDLQQAYFWAIAASNNAVRTGTDEMKGHRIAALIRYIRSRIPHQVAAQASSAAARLTGQPI